MVSTDLIYIHERNRLLNVSLNGAFKSFRGASQWAIDEGYEVSYDDDLSELLTEHTIIFTSEDKENDLEYTAFIEEFSIFE